MTYRRRGRYWSVLECWITSLDQKVARSLLDEQRVVQKTDYLPRGNDAVLERTWCGLLETIIDARLQRLWQEWQDGSAAPARPLALQSVVVRASTTTGHVGVLCVPAFEQVGTSRLAFDTHCCHMGTAIKHPVPAVICNFWHPGTLTLRAERQSARVSKNTNDGLTRSGTGCFIAVPIWQQWASNGYNSVDDRVGLNASFRDSIIRQRKWGTRRAAEFPTGSMLWHSLHPNNMPADCPIKPKCAGAWYQLQESDKDKQERWDLCERRLAGCRCYHQQLNSSSHETISIAAWIKLRLFSCAGLTLNDRLKSMTDEIPENVENKSLKSILWTVWTAHGLCILERYHSIVWHLLALVNFGLFFLYLLNFIFWYVSDNGACLKNILPAIRCRVGTYCHTGFRCVILVFNLE